MLVSVVANHTQAAMKVDVAVGVSPSIIVINNINAVVMATFQFPKSICLASPKIRPLKFLVCQARTHELQMKMNPKNMITIVRFWSEGHTVWYSVASSKSSAFSSGVNPAIAAHRIIQNPAITVRMILCQRMYRVFFFVFFASSLYLTLIKLLIAACLSINTPSKKKKPTRSKTTRRMHVVSVGSPTENRAEKLSIVDPSRNSPIVSTRATFIAAVFLNLSTMINPNALTAQEMQVKRRITEADECESGTYAHGTETAMTVESSLRIQCDRYTLTAGFPHGSISGSMVARSECV
mmetsp:Transcript_32212/g.51274  ORF Transcript_32212/g.51274 Transcript_32212/m.51274 type:complete len:294 (+) Transcript_32212:220-1101(+)